MGLLLGLPLRLLGLIFVLIRFLIPIALLALLVWLWRRHRGAHAETGEKKGAPHFKGPVYTVDYKDVKSEDERNDD